MQHTPYFGTGVGISRRSKITRYAHARSVQRPFCWEEDASRRRSGPFSIDDYVIITSFFEILIWWNERAFKTLSNKVKKRKSIFGSKFRVQALLPARRRYIVSIYPTQQYTVYSAVQENECIPDIIYYTVYYTMYWCMTFVIAHIYILITCKYLHLGNSHITYACNDNMAKTYIDLYWVLYILTLILHPFQMWIFFNQMYVIVSL